MAVAAGLVSVLVVIVNPLVMMSILGLLGYRKRTAFMASLAVSSISEFSLILVSGVAGLSSLLTVVAVVTMSFSSYLIWNDHRVFKKFSRYLWWVGKGGHLEKVDESGLELSGHGVLFGHNRVGERVRPALEQLVSSVLVVDFNPEVVGELKEKGVKVIYGDMSDHELYGRLALDKAAIIISTVPDLHDNLLLLSSLSESKSKRLVIATADNAFEAKELYKAGADYVLLPHFVGGNYLSFVLEQHSAGDDLEKKLANLGAYLKKERSHA